MGRNNLNQSEIDTELKSEIDNYKWTKRGEVFLGEKIVEKKRIQRFIVNTTTSQAKIKRDGKDYHHFRKQIIIEPIIKYLVQSYAD